MNNGEKFTKVCIKGIVCLIILQLVRITFNTVYFNYFPNGEITGHITTSIFMLGVSILFLIKMRREMIPFFQ